LDCGSPLPLCVAGSRGKSGSGLPQSKTLRAARSPQPLATTREDLSFVTAAATNCVAAKSLPGGSVPRTVLPMPAYQELTPERVAELRLMTGEQKLMIAEQMFWDARRAKAGEVKQAHPDWSEQEVQSEVKRIFLAEAMKEG
jgi:hypothetical protein